MEVSASNPFEMQAKLYAELTDDIFRYYSVPKNSQLKHKTSLSEPLSEAIKPTILAIRKGFSDVLHFATGQSYYPRTPQDTPGRSTIPKGHIKIPMFVHFYHHFINMKVYFH